MGLFHPRRDLDGITLVREMGGPATGPPDREEETRGRFGGGPEIQLDKGHMILGGTTREGGERLFSTRGEREFLGGKVMGRAKGTDEAIQRDRPFRVRLGCPKVEGVEILDDSGRFRLRTVRQSDRIFRHREITIKVLRDRDLQFPVRRRPKMGDGGIGVEGRFRGTGVGERFRRHRLSVVKEGERGVSERGHPVKTGPRGD